MMIDGLLLAAALAVNITVSNPTDMQRQELVEVSADDVRTRLGIGEGQPMVVLNGKGQQVDYQLAHDGSLLIDACVVPHGTTVYTVKAGSPKTMKPWVYGAQYPFRKDDIAWENDRGAYRIYGPALQRTGEKAYGIDVWTKNTPELVVAERYYKDYRSNVEENRLYKAGRKEEARQLDLESSFHNDHGDGLDCYGVGPTLGCGAPALMVGGELVMPYCYKDYEILDNGPLRFTVALTYNPAAVGNSQHVVEHRVISLDKGSNFNRITVWYEGLSEPCDLAAGVVIHETDTEHVVIGKDYVQYADPTDQPGKHGYQLYVAALFPDGAKTTKRLYAKPSGGNAGHALGIVKRLGNNQPYTYFAGSAWSCHDVRTQQEWQLRVESFLEARRAPLEVTVSGNF